MSYTEVIFSHESSNDETNDIITAFISDLGFDSFVNHENGLYAYILDKHFDTNLLDNILGDIPVPNLQISYTYNKVSDKNWNEEWEKNSFTPIEIDNKCIIQSSRHTTNEQFEYNIFINPEMSFGTGHHQTTEMMMKYVLQLDIKGKSVLDMGCGTAVLAILASMRGASHIAAIDIDQWAYKNALDNIALNNITNIDVLKGDASILGNKKYDIILANINRNILLNDINCYAAILNENGILVMSGFYTEDIPVLEKEYSKYDLIRKEAREKEGWAAILLNKIL